MNRLLSLASCFAVLGCVPQSKGLAPRGWEVLPLPEESAERRLVGSWEIIFGLDSTIQLDTSAMPPVIRRVPYSSKRVISGQLIIQDSLIQPFLNGPLLLLADIDIDFTPLLGRQISCLMPANRAIAARISEDTLTVSLTPLAADCGLAASGQLFADSAVGDWVEPAYSGYRSSGSFVMRRLMK